MADPELVKRLVETSGIAEEKAIELIDYAEEAVRQAAAEIKQLQDDAGRAVYETLEKGFGGGASIVVRWGELSDAEKAPYIEAAEAAMDVWYEGEE